MSIVQQPATTPNINQNGPVYLDTLTNRYLVRPATVKGIGGFVFDYEGEESLSLHADITDHFTETNSAIQDHVARGPVHMTLRGFVAELVYQVPSGILGAINSIQNRLTTVPAYLGKYTPGSTATIQGALTKTISTISQINQAMARVKNVVGLFGNAAPGQTKQEQAFAKLASLWETNQMMLVETPFGIFGNMVIEDLTFVQEDATRGWSDITVKLKGMRFAAVQTATIDFKSGRAVQQAQATADKGSTKGTPVNRSVLRSLFPNVGNP